MVKIPEIAAFYRGRILHMERAAGASQTPAYFARTAEGPGLFIKHDPAGTGLLEAEADGLQALADTGAIAVPRVYGGDPRWLVMEAIDRERATPAFWKALAEGLVALHRCSQPLGWHRDNFIGRMPQYNQCDGDSWPNFFWERRLLPQIEQLRKAGIWERDEERHHSLLQERVFVALSAVREPISLLHGDLWSGNILCAQGQRPYLIDPAVYAGHRETDLAMTELFGGFSREFYQRYDALWPLAPGYEERKVIYNFYHKLNHANLYGSGYIWDVKKTLRDIVLAQPPMAEKL